jgi:hypothetical protein
MWVRVTSVKEEALRVLGKRGHFQPAPLLTASTSYTYFVAEEEARWAMALVVQVALETDAA